MLRAILLRAFLMPGLRPDPMRLPPRCLVCFIVVKNCAFSLFLFLLRCALLSLPQPLPCKCALVDRSRRLRIRDCPVFPMLPILRAWLVRFLVSWFGRDQCFGCSEWQIFISLHWSGRCHPLQETDHCCTYSGRSVPQSFALVLFAALSLVWVAKTFSFLSTTLNLCFGVFINISAPSFASMCCKFPHHIQLLPSQPPQSPTGF